LAVGVWRSDEGRDGAILKAMKFAERNLVELRIMHIWEEADDEQVVPLLRQLWDEIRSAHER